LDVLAGIGAGGVKAGTGDEEAIRTLFHLGNALATVGVYAYLAATLVAAAGVLPRARLPALPGALLVVGGAISFLDSHIYWPRGVLTMIFIGLGWAALIWAQRPRMSR
jgi:hypothetical protein